jgi:hypothetical protein
MIVRSGDLLFAVAYSDRPVGEMGDLRLSKWTKEGKHDTEKPDLNRVKQISILARGISERKPDIR